MNRRLVDQNKPSKFLMVHAFYFSNMGTNSLEVLSIVTYTLITAFILSTWTDRLALTV